MDVSILKIRASFEEKNGLRVFEPKKITSVLTSVLTYVFLLRLCQGEKGKLEQRGG
jgi:hypothetical protein